MKTSANSSPTEGFLDSMREKKRVIRVFTESGREVDDGRLGNTVDCVAIMTCSRELGGPEVLSQSGYDEFGIYWVKLSQFWETSRTREWKY